MAKHKRKRRAWTQQELDFLAANWSAMQVSELAAKLGRPLVSVQKKAGDLCPAGKRVSTSGRWRAAK